VTHIESIIIGSVISHVQESRSYIYILPVPSCLCLAYGNCIIPMTMWFQYFLSHASQKCLLRLFATHQSYINWPWTFVFIVALSCKKSKLKRDNVYGKVYGPASNLIKVLFYKIVTYKYHLYLCLMQNWFSHDKKLIALNSLIFNIKYFGN